MCYNGQQNITYDKWTVKQSGIKYNEIIYLKTKQNEIVDYDYTNGNLSVISTSIYYHNKQPYFYPLAYVTLYEKGCQTPILSAYSKFLQLVGNTVIKMTRNYSPGYKLRVCIKFDFKNRSPSSTGSTSNQDGTAEDIVYSIKQDNIIFEQKKQLYDTKNRTQQIIVNKEILANKTREDAKPIDCSKYVAAGTGDTTTNSNPYSAAI